MPQDAPFRFCCVPLPGIQEIQWYPRDKEIVRLPPRPVLQGNDGVWSVLIRVLRKWRGFGAGGGRRENFSLLKK